MGPLGALYLAGVLTLDPAHAELTARSFGQALRADDVRAFATLTGESLPQGASWKSVLELIEHFDEVTITATRVAASPVLTAAGTSLLTVEVTGSAVTAGQRRVRVLPRWWSLELRAGEDGPRVTSALTLERRLAEELATATAERLDAFLGEHSELDTERFLMQLADAASEHGEAGRPAVSWALAQARRRQLPRAEGGALESLSLLPFFAGSPAAMVAPAEEGVAIATRGGDADVLAGTLFALAVAYWFNDRTDEAIATFKRIGALVEAVEQPGTVLRAVHMAAYLEVDSRRLREALETAQRQAGMLARHPLPRPAVDAAFMAADIHTHLGNFAVSRREYERALALATSIGDRGLQAMALTAIAWIASESGEPSEAERLLSRALTVGQGAMEKWDEATTLIELGNVLLREGKLDEAETRLQQGAEIAKGTGESLVLAAAELGLSELNVRAGRAAQALSLAQDARRRLQLLDAPTRASKQGLAVWRALAAEGRAELASGSAKRAEASWRQAVEMLEGSRQELALDAGERAARFAQTLSPYRDLLDLLVAQERSREALQVAEQMRARALRDTLQAGRVDLSSTVAPADRAREDELEQNLEQLNLAALGSGHETQANAVAARDEARLALQRFQAELYLRHPDLSRRRAPVIADALELAEVVIPPRGAVLELVVADDHTTGLLLSRGADGRVGITVRRLAVGAAAIGERVEELLSRVETADPEFTNGAGELYRLLVGPFEGALGGVEVLCVIPDGALWSLPFSLLRDAGGKPLVERMAVFHAPSLAALSGRRPPPDGTAPPLLALAMGNPTVLATTVEQVRAMERGPALGSLPHAEQEVRAIGDLYGPHRSDVLVGLAARERTLKEAAGRYALIHIASHGLVDDRAPLYSAVVLAGGDDGEDGLLEAREIADLRLSARLVVLSACETGRGKIRAGEGVIGLSWAFLAAGVPTLVVSDWRVASAATADLMVELHRQLVAGAAPAAALRRAQLTMLRDPRYEHPYFWAPFVVVGSGW